MTALHQRSADVLPSRSRRLPAIPVSLGGLSQGKLSFLVILAAGYSIAAVLFSCRGAFITSMLNDMFVFLDGAYRMSSGQIPHRDFESPISILTFAIFEIGLNSTGDAARAVSIAMAVATFFFSPIVAYVIASRMHIAIAFPIATYLLLLISAPMNTGEQPSQITIAMIYNRICWSAMMIVLFLIMEPRIRFAASSYIDKFIICLMLIMCLYIKITYFIVIVGLFVSWSLLHRRFRSTAVPVLIGVVSVAVVMESILHIHTAYYRDIQFFLAAAGPIRNGIGLLLYKQMLNVAPTLAVVGVALLLVLRRSLTLREGLLWVAVIVASFALLNQNAQPRELPPLIALIAIAAEKATRDASTLSAEGRSSADVSLLYMLWLLLLVSLAQPTTNTAVALVRYVSQSLFAEPRVDLLIPLRHLVVADPPLQGLRREYLAGPLRNDDYDRARLYEQPDRPNPLYQSEYLETVVDGARTIQPLVHGRSVLVFDFVNPLSFLLGLPSPPGLPISNMAGITFSTQVHIPPEQLFADQPLVAVPKRAIAPITRDALVEIYRPYLELHYRVAADTASWTILLPR